MREYYDVDIEWDDGHIGTNYIITNMDDHEEDGPYSDEEIFYYGMSWDEIQENMKAGVIDSIEEWKVIRADKIVD